MNSAGLLLLFLFCFSVSFHQFPQLSVTILLRALAAGAETFAVLQKDFFFLCEFPLKLLGKNDSLKVRVEQRPWNDSVAKTLFFVFFKTLIS